MDGLDHLHHNQVINRLEVVPVSGVAELRRVRLATVDQGLDRSIVLSADLLADLVGYHCHQVLLNRGRLSDPSAREDSPLRGGAENQVEMIIAKADSGYGHGASMLRRGW